MKIITVTNLKGGVGKTTSAVNIAYSLSTKEGCRVLVVDADPQANLTPFFVRQLTGKTILDLYKNPANVRSCIYKTRYDRIDIIKGNTGLREDDVQNIGDLGTALRKEYDYYDYCIIDTRPAFERITLSAIHAADTVLIPVNMDKFCRDNLNLVDDMMDSIGKSNWNIFVTKINARSKSQRENYEDLLSRHDYPFLETAISRSADVDNALNLYKPVGKHKSKSVVAADYDDLAEEIAGLEV